MSVPVLRFILVSVAFSLACVQSAFAVETIDRILVVVNDEIITESDMNEVLAPVITRIRATSSDQEIPVRIEEARAHYLEQMIQDRLIVSAAREAKMEVEESEVDEMISEMRKKFPSQEVFEEILHQQGLSFSKLRDRFYDDILKQRMIEYKVKSRVSFSPGEVRDYYNENTDEFVGEREAQVRQILIRTGSIRSDEAARTFANAVVEKLEQGEDMAQLARDYSDGLQAQDGGDMGWVAEGQFLERLDRAIFRLNVGEHTAPIKTQLGYHIFKVEETREPRPLSFDEVRNRIESYIYRTKVNTKLGAWLDELRDNAYIAYQG